MHLEPIYLGSILFNKLISEKMTTAIERSESAPPVAMHQDNSSYENQRDLSNDSHSIAQQASNIGFDFGKTPILPETTANKDLPRDLQANMEGAFGIDFSNVEIYKNSKKAQDLDALAYTQGDEVHFAPGQFNTSSDKGRNLIGHEFSHIVQQRSGVVQPTSVMGKGLPINENRKLENEADSMGQKAVRGEKVHNYNPATFQQNTNSSSIQFYTKVTGLSYNRVSDDGKMAVKDHTKDAWAESSNIARSNKILDSLNSKAKIKELNTNLTVPVPVPGKSKAKSRKLKKFEMIDRLTNAQVDLTDDCGDACQELMGGKSTVTESFVAANKKGSTQEFTNPAVYEADDLAAGGIVSTTENLSGQIYVRIMKREFGKKLSRTEALKKWSKLSAKEKRRLSKKYGINKHAVPKTGQGITIGTERDMPGVASGGFNFHFGFALLSSKKDYISLEDFARSGQKYYYKMYGPASKKQSFAEDTDNTGPLGNKTTTMVVLRPESLKGELNADNVRLKSSPKKTNAKAKLAKGTKVKILRKGNNWMKIEVLSGSNKGESGWILNKFYIDT